MEIIASVAIGLNPYVGAFIVAALSAFSGRVPLGEFGSNVPPTVVTVAAVLLGLALPVDFILGKFIRFAPSVRRTSQYVAPVAAAFFTACISRSELPLAVVACGSAVLSWGVATMLTGFAARASRSAAWVGLGHIPVLMAAATAAACIVPLGMAKLGIGLTLAMIAVTGLLWSTVDTQRIAYATRRRSVRRLVGAPGAISIR